MLHLTFQNSQKTARVEIQNNVMKLLFDMDFTIETTPLNGTGGEGYAKMLANAFYAAANGKISVTRYSGQLGTKQLVANMKFADLAEICANNEGFIHIRRKSMVGVNSSVWVFNAQFSIELSNSGAIHADKTDFLVVELDGFSTYTWGDTNQQFDTSIKIYSLGSYIVKNEHLKYSPVACNANQLQAFDCQSHYAIALPSTLNKCYLHSAGGELLEVRNEEMEIVAADVSDCVFMCDGYNLPFYKWRVFPIQLAYKAQVQTTANDTCYLMSNKDFEPDHKPISSHRD